MPLVKIANPLGSAFTTKKKADGFVKRNMAEYLADGTLRFLEQNQRQRIREEFHRTEGGGEAGYVPRRARRVWDPAPSLVRTGPDCPARKLHQIAEIFDDSVLLAIPSHPQYKPLLKEIKDHREDVERQRARERATLEPKPLGA